MRSKKCWDIYSIVLGAVTSFLPGVMYTLTFDGKLPAISAASLWFLTTAIILEDWWWTESIFRRLPTNSWSVVLVSFLYLMGILSFPAILLGVRNNLPDGLRYYGWAFIVVSFLDALFCFVYWRAVGREFRQEFQRYILLDVATIASAGLWISYVLPAPGLLTIKTVVLTFLYLMILFFAAMIHKSYQSN